MFTSDYAESSLSCTLAGLWMTEKGWIKRFYTHHCHWMNGWKVTIDINGFTMVFRISSSWTSAPFVAWLRAGPDQAPLVSLHFALVGKTELKRSVNSSFFSLSIQKLAVISHWLAMCQSLHCQPCHCEPVLAWLGALPHRPDQTVTCLPRVCGLPREGDG